MALAKFRRTADREGGFSILEVLFASMIMIAGAASLAQLFWMSTRTNSAAKNTSFTALLAQQKMEQLRALEWGFDVLGLPSNDTTTDTTVVPETAGGGTGLSPSPPGTLNSNVTGWVDYLDKNGASLGGGSTIPNNASYVRRWSVEPLPTNPNNTLILQVFVMPRTTTGTDSTTSVARDPQGARMMSIKTRKTS